VNVGDGVTRLVRLLDDVEAATVTLRNGLSRSERDDPSGRCVMEVNQVLMLQQKLKSVQQARRHAASVAGTQLAPVVVMTRGKAAFAVASAKTLLQTSGRADCMMR